MQYAWQNTKFLNVHKCTRLTIESACSRTSRMRLAVELVIPLAAPAPMPTVFTRTCCLIDDTSYTNIPWAQFNYHRQPGRAVVLNPTGALVVKGLSTTSYATHGHHDLVARRMEVGLCGQLRFSTRSCYPTTRTPLTSVESTKLFPPWIGSMYSMPQEVGEASSDLCECSETQKMSHIVDACPQTRLERGLQALHEAGASAVESLKRRWLAYANNNHPQLSSNGFKNKHG